jgi:hypothetical protein
MPDLEQIADDLRMELAKTPEDKAFASGYIKGRNHARKEFAIAMAFAILLYLSIKLSA